MISTLPSPPSWQVIYIPDEDSTFRLVGIRNYPLAASRYISPLGPLAPEVVAEMGDGRESICNCSSRVRCYPSIQLRKSKLTRSKTAQRDISLSPTQRITYLPPFLLEKSGRRSVEASSLKHMRNKLDLLIYSEVYEVRS